MQAFLSTKQCPQFCMYVISFNPLTMIYVEAIIILHKEAEIK